MRFLLRLLLLATVSSLLIFGTVGLASAGDWGRVASAKHGNGQGASAQGGAQGAASQAGAQGASTNHGGCLIVVPGLPSAIEGTGNVVVNQAGTNFTCHGELPAGETLPDRPVKVEDGDCVTLVTPSGQAQTTCHSRP